VKLDLFMLADAAKALEHRLYVHGGGVTRIDVAAVPSLQPQLALVARFRIDPEDYERTHRFSLEITDPAGAPAGATEPFDVPPPAEKPQFVEGEEAYLQLALTFGPLLLIREGIYRLQFAVNGEVVRTMTLPVFVRDGVT
jgi:hypothetical protein